MNSRGSATNAMLRGDTVEEIYSYIDDNVQRHLDGAVPKPPRNEAMPMKPMNNSIPRSPISKPPRNEAVCWQPTAVDRSKRARINCISTCVAFSFCIHFVLILFSVGCGLSLYQINKKIDGKSCSFVNESGERPHISHRLILQMCNFSRRCGHRGSSGYQGYTCPSNSSS